MKLAPTCDASVFVLFSDAMLTRRPGRPRAELSARRDAAGVMDRDDGDDVGTGLVLDFDMLASERGAAGDVSRLGGATRLTGAANKAPGDPARSSSDVSGQRVAIAAMSAHFVTAGL